jgi:hypothetical protein
MSNKGYLTIDYSPKPSDKVFLEITREELSIIDECLEEHGRDSRGFRYRPDIQDLQNKLKRQSEV